MTSTNFTLLSVTATTPIRTDQPIKITDPEVTVPGNEDESGGEFETTSSTTTANEITTKEPAATAGAGMFSNWRIAFFNIKFIQNIFF